MWMNHESLGKNKEGIMNNEGQMIPLPLPKKDLSITVSLVEYKASRAASRIGPNPKTTVSTKSFHTGQKGVYRHVHT